MQSIRVGFLYTRLRAEEKYLLEELEKRPNMETVRINDGDHFFDISNVPEKVDVLFLSLYSRLPQAREKALIYQTLEEAGGSKTIWEDLTVAALSTQRFLFIE